MAASNTLPLDYLRDVPRLRRVADVAQDYQTDQERFATASAEVAGRMWDEVDPQRIFESWAERVPELTAIVSGAQRGAARQADPYLGDVLSAQGLDEAADAAVDPEAFAGAASDGRGLASLLNNPVFVALTSIPIPGVTVPKAMAAGRQNLEMLVHTQVSDAGRLATQTSLVAHPAAQGYIRMTDGNPCSRCLILSGRFYLWNRGFLRHPRCGCVHVPAGSRLAKRIPDPRAVYDAMTPLQRVKAGFSAGDRAAIAEGADIAQVVNARRGVYVAGGRQFTTEGTTALGFARSRLGPGVPRITPDQILRDATSREDAIRLLHRNGYLIEMPPPAVLPPVAGPLPSVRPLPSGRPLPSVRPQPSVAPLPSGRPLPSTRPLPDRQLLRGLDDVTPVPPRPTSAGVSGGGATRISDLPRVANPDDRLAQAMATNPRYGGAYEGPITPALEREIQRAGAVSYSQNCTRVVIAHEMRRRGIDVTAGVGTSLGDTTLAYIRTFRTPEGAYAVRVAEDLSRNMSLREVVVEVESWPLGSRGIVTMKGHTLNVERDAVTGRAVFVDAQAARERKPVMDVAGLRRRMKSRGAPTDGAMAVARVDDLELSDYGLRYVESPELDITRGQVGRTPDIWLPGSDRVPTYEQIARLTPDDTYTGLPKGPPKRTGTQLRAAVTERGITVPTGLRAPALEQLVADLERGVAPATAREAAVRTILEERQGIAKALSEAAEMAANGGSARALQHLGGTLHRRLSAEQAKTARVLLEGLDAGDIARVRAALPVVARAAKLKPVGEIGQVSRFEGARMSRIAESAGDDVIRVVRPGYETTFEGKTVTVLRADVQAATPEQAAALRAPVKAAKKAAPRKSAAPKAPASGETAVRAATPLDIADEKAFRQAVGEDVFREVRDYKGIFSRLIQQDAAGGGGSARLDAAMARSRLTRDVEVFRGQTWEALEADVGRKLADDQSLAGLTFTRPRYVSTSWEEQMGRAFGNRRDEVGVLLRIRAPEGTGAVAIGGGEAELLLERGLTFRVVADRGVQVTGRFRHRVLDVEVVPARAAKKAVVKAPPAPAKMTAPALRKELQPVASGLDLAAVPKPTLERWVARARELPVSERAAEVGRWRQVVVDKQKSVAEVLAQVDGLLDSGASAAALASRGRAALSRIEATIKGWPDEAAVRSLVTAMQAGNPAAIRRAITAVERKAGLTRIGEQAGKVTRYDRAAMSPIDGARIADGAQVAVVRPGYSVEIGGQRVVLSKPVVEMHTPPVKVAKKAAPAKAPPTVAVRADALKPGDRIYVRERRSDGEIVPAATGGRPVTVVSARRDPDSGTFAFEIHAVDDAGREVLIVSTAKETTGGTGYLAIHDPIRVERAASAKKAAPGKAR